MTAWGFSLNKDGRRAFFGKPILGGKDDRFRGIWIVHPPRESTGGPKAAYLDRPHYVCSRVSLRRLLVVGATSVICARARPYKYPWVTELLGRRPTKVVAVALANKIARIAWAVLAKGKPYRSPTRSSNTVVLAA